MDLSFKKNDFITIIIVFLIGIIFCAIFFMFQKQGNYVELSVDGEVIKEFSLDKNIEYKIENNKDYNTLVIEDGYAYIKEASCPDLLCVHMKKINKTGQSIVCLPNKVVVFIKGNDKELDAVVGVNFE